MAQICVHPNCNKAGEYAAPVEPGNSRARQYFCLEHIREFNKNWNGLQGMSADQLYAIQSGNTYWQNKTFPIGENPAQWAKLGLNFDTADDLLSFFKERQGSATAQRSSTTGETLPADVQDARKIMGITEPHNAATLKVQYVKLLKEHHPDRHGGSKVAEENMKKLNVAYKILQDWSIRQGLDAA